MLPNNKNSQRVCQNFRIQAPLSARQLLSNTTKSFNPADSADSKWRLCYHDIQCGGPNQLEIDAGAQPAGRIGAQQPRSHSWDQPR